jgi:hypothetical protein
MANELCNQPFKMILFLLKRGLEHVGYFDALASLHKDLFVRDLFGAYSTAVRVIWLWL